MELKIYSPAEDGFIKKIEWNYEELKKEIEVRSAEYAASVYTDDSIKNAKADRAQLNKFKDALNGKRLEVRRQMLEPYEEFGAQIKSLTDIVQGAIDNIDGQVKDYENRQRKMKEAKIREFYDENIFDIRQEYCYCVEATMGNPFPCAMVGSGMVETLRQEIGESCQFVNLDLAERKVGTDEPVPCCQQCANPCAYACQISKKCVATSQQKEPTALPNGGEAAAEKQQEECTNVEIEKIHNANEEPEKQLIEYDQEILDGMIREVQQKLYIMKEYWIKSQPQYYTKHRMMLRAYELLMKAGS